MWKMRREELGKRGGHSSLHRREDSWKRELPGPGVGEEQGEGPHTKGRAGGASARWSWRSCQGSD